jgi:glutaredoxin 3
MSEVIIYTTPTCGYCNLAKQFFHSNGVAFTEKDVSTDINAQKEMQKYGARGVPLIIVGTEVIRGFDKSRLEELFGKLIIECPKCRSKLRLPRDKGILEVKCTKCQTTFQVDSNKH